MNEDEERRIMSAGLGRAELEFATSICAPLYWLLRRSNDQIRVRNGTAFFLDAGLGPFAVTAAHVLAGIDDDRCSGEVETIGLGRNLILDLDDRHKIIDRDADIDIATFQISADEIQGLSKTVLTGRQDTWPPLPPKRGRGVYYSGFPGQATRSDSLSEICFGAAAGGGVASSVGERDISTQFDRSCWIDVMELGLPPENYDFGGMSGGPMLSVIERNGLRSWSLAGVIYQGPNPSAEIGQSIPGFEVLKARRAQFLRPDGKIDRSFWAAP